MTDPVVLISSGDVVGPNSATNGTMVLFDGTSGKKIKGNNSVVTVQGLALLDDIDAASQRATIGLQLVDNTSDLNKPASDPVKVALQAQTFTAFTTAGSSSAYTLTPTPAITAYTTPLRFRVKFHATGSLAPTINISGAGVVNLKQYSDTGNKIPAVIYLNQISDVEYDGTDAVVMDPMPTGLPKGYFAGFQLGNNSAAPTNTLDVSGGSARNLMNTLDITLASTLRGVMQTSGTWAAGDNQNKLDTGVRTANTNYHIFAIRKTSDGTGDILFSLSATAPTMPTGYAGFIRISTMRVESGGNFRLFFNWGNFFNWLTPVMDVDTVGAQTVPVLFTLSVPTDVVVLARFGVCAYGGSTDMGVTYSPVSANNIPSGGYAIYTGGFFMATNATDTGGVNCDCIADNAQVRFNSINRLKVATFGWMEIR